MSLPAASTEQGLLLNLNTRNLHTPSAALDLALEAMRNAGVRPKGAAVTGTKASTAVTTTESQSPISIIG